jgi:hypothetical protein
MDNPKSLITFKEIATAIEKLRKEIFRFRQFHWGVLTSTNFIRFLLENRRGGAFPK